MSADRPVPRPRSTEAASSHMRPAEPFPPASDVTLDGVHRSVVALTVQQTQLIDRLGEHETADAQRHQQVQDRLDVIHRDMVLRFEDLNPRVATVEKRTIGAKARPIAGWGGVAVTLLTVGAELAAQFKPGAVGPLHALAQTIAQMFGGG